MMHGELLNSWEMWCGELMLSTDELSKVTHMRLHRKCILDLIQIKSQSYTFLIS